MSSQLLYTSGSTFAEGLNLGMSTKDFVWCVVLSRPSANLSPTAYLSRNKSMVATHFRLNSAPLINVEVLTSSTPECDLIWRQGLYRDNQVKVRYRVSVGGCNILSWTGWLTLRPLFVVVVEAGKAVITVPADPVSGLDLLADVHLLAVSSHSGEQRGAVLSPVSSYKDTDSICEGSTFLI